MGALGVVMEQDIEDYAHLLSLVATLDSRRRHLVDLSGVEAHSVGAMRRIVELYEGGAPGILKEAVVRPKGVVGAFAEGFFQSLSRQIDAAVFPSMDEAIAWLEEDGSTTELMRVGLAMIGGRTSDRIRSLLLNSDASFAVDEVARKLGLSRRTLQRRLKEENASFSRIKREVIVERAANLLVSSTLSIKAIATALHLRSSDHLRELFLAERNTSPRDFRRDSCSKG